MNYGIIRRLFFILVISFAMSCARHPVLPGVSIVASSPGLMKSNLAPFPIFLTDALISRNELEKKYSKDLFIVHTGHILKNTLTKEENENNLEKLSTLGFNLVNLTLEDFVVADSQKINFEKYNIVFINSSVIDLTHDEIASAMNINSYFTHEGLAFIGLSDSKLDRKVIKEKYIINDYVLSILKVKRNILKNSDTIPVNSFILVHTLGKEINEVMERLPPSFINSLAK